MAWSIPPHTGFSPPQAPTIPVPAKAGWRAGWLALSGGVNGQCEQAVVARAANGRAAGVGVNKRRRRCERAAGGGTRGKRGGRATNGGEEG